MFRQYIIAVITIIISHALGSDVFTLNANYISFANVSKLVNATRIGRVEDGASDPIPILPDGLIFGDIIVTLAYVSAC